jgi:phospho-N-acetylmuramoyl-pentapeptide-transferase
LPKLLLQIVAVAVGFQLAPTGIGSTDVPVTPPFEFQLLTLVEVGFVVLFFANAFNFADGLDGLAAFVCLGILLGLACIGAFTGNDTFPGAWIGGTFGAVIPFLVLNVHPAKIFMGDVGALPLGALLGSATSTLLPLVVVEPSNVVRTSSGMFIAKHTSWELASLPWWVPIALMLLSGVMIAELVPVALQILWVKLFKRKLFLRTPIHHAFEVMGWPETKIVRLFALTQLGLSAAAAMVVWIGTRGMQP